MLSAELSPTGQVVIPQKVRDALGLEVGALFRVGVQEGKIILEPLPRSPIDSLYGKYAPVDLLSDQEAEHTREIER